MLLLPLRPPPPPVPPALLSPPDPFFRARLHARELERARDYLPRKSWHATNPVCADRPWVAAPRRGLDERPPLRFQSSLR